MLDTDGKWVLQELARKRESISLAMRYYDGDHRLLFATERYRETFSRTFAAFADNLCAAVVDAKADRLQVRGFDVQASAAAAATGSSPDEENNAAGALWQASAMQVNSGLVHTDALVAGETAVIVWREDPLDVPRFYVQHPGQIAWRFDAGNPGQVAWGGKAWRLDDRRTRLTLYYADRIERYVTAGPSQSGGIPTDTKRFRAFTEDGHGAIVPNEWGVVPLFPFANARGVGVCGRSELAPALPLQDAINKAVCDMLVAMEFVAWPQRWATGIAEERDPTTGESVPPFKPGAERLWTTEGTDGSFGQFPQADLGQHVTVQRDLREELGNVTGTPRHLLVGVQGADWPSGEALVQAEARLVKRCRDLLLAWSFSWSSAMSLALRMATFPADGVVETMWEPPETRQDRVQADTVEVKKRIGISRGQALRELGYTEEQIAMIEGELADDAQASAAAFAAGALPAGGSTG